MTIEIPVYGVHLVEEDVLRVPVRRAGDADTAAKIIQSFIADRDREVLVALFVDPHLQPIGLHTIAIGPQDALKTTGREVFRAAILARAHALVLGHNHPSGMTRPSEEDFAFTRTMVEAGRLLGIAVVDHVIVTPSGAHTSLAQLGKMIDAA
jgi:DNA repair protein RadC